VDGSGTKVDHGRESATRSVILTCGKAESFIGSADLILTNPYGPLPKQLQTVPMLICNFEERHRECEQYCGTSLHKIGEWGEDDRRCTFWAGNTSPIPVDIAGLVPDTYANTYGWFPLELPLRLLKVYGKPGITVWDGFMGRGTTGKACQILGMDFIGMDVNPERVELAKRYLSE
jgi:hypothetical protein